ncbi:MAG TPA: hypothetical protein VFN71_14710, partial [Methylomirabilota bacterium]|nr:hypothetical protein [Methylomirabilota bacterium]
MAKIVFSPPLPKAIMDLALEMLPAGYELHVTDRAAPDFAKLMADAEYWMGFARAGMDESFFKIAPKLKLLQL